MSTFFKRNECLFSDKNDSELFVLFITLLQFPFLFQNFSMKCILYWMRFNKE